MIRCAALVTVLLATTGNIGQVSADTIKREWTKSDGTSLGECTLVQIMKRPQRNQWVAAAVRLKPHSGRTFEVPLSELSGDDRRFVEDRFRRQLAADGLEIMLKNAAQRRQQEEKTLRAAERERQEKEQRRREEQAARTGAAASAGATPGGIALDCSSGDQVITTREVLAEASGAGASGVLQKLIGGEAEPFFGHLGAVSVVLLSSDGRILVSTTGSSPDAEAGKEAAYPIKVWSTANQQLLRSLEGHTKPIRSAALGPDGRLLASLSIDGEVRLWSLVTGDLVKVIPGDPQHTEGRSTYGQIAIADEGRLLVFLNEQGVTRWSLPDGEQLPGGVVFDKRIFGSDDVFPQTLNVDSTGTTAVVGGDYIGADGYGHPFLWKWSLDDGELQSCLPGASAHAVALTTDGLVLVCGGENGITVWSTADGELLWWFKPDQTGLVVSLAVSPDGSRIYSGSTDGAVRVWSIEDGRLVMTLNGHRSSVTSLTLSADGSFLVSASNLGIVSLWCVRSREFIAYFIDVTIKSRFVEYVIYFFDPQARQRKATIDYKEVPLAASQTRWVLKDYWENVLRPSARSGSGASGGSGGSYTITTYSYSYSYSISY